MVYEARGENREAADCYRKVIAFMREHPDNYDPAFEDKFVKLVDKLDPPSPPDQRWPKVHDTQRSSSHNHHILRAQNTRSNLRIHGDADALAQIGELSDSWLRSGVWPLAPASN